MPIKPTDKSEIPAGGSGVPVGGGLVLIGTMNPGKFMEIMEVLGDLPLNFCTLRDLGINENAEETGETYEDNASAKAKFYHRRSGILTIAEDSGIVVDALKGELGVKTRRWGAGENANDEEWISYFLEAMKDVPPDRRTARFICAAAAVDRDGEVKYFRGEAEGVITSGLEAPIYAGLPLSSCFRPVGFDKVYAALTPNEKNAVSHRGKAMKQVRDFLGR
jgi:XTP/dITP diphosphohydrolase